MSVEGGRVNSERIVLAYSGGLVSSSAIPWLIERRGVDVVAVTLDVGQGRQIEGVRERALAAGAIRAHVLDRSHAFVADMAWPVVQAGIDPEPSDVLLAAPLVAQALVEIARLERATLVAHGARGEVGRALDALIRAVDPRVDVVSPEIPLDRDEIVAWLDARGLSAPGGDAALVAEATIWGTSVRGPALADAWHEAPDAAFTSARPAAECPDTPAHLEITFDRGVPLEVNGVAMPLTELVDSVATIAGAHGVGRDDVVGARGADRTREVRDAPAAAVLRQAHRALAAAVLSGEEMAFRAQAAGQYLSLLRGGRWLSGFREDLDAYRDRVQARLTGTVRLRLFKGHSQVVGRRVAQYDPQLMHAAAGE